MRWEEVRKEEKNKNMLYILEFLFKFLQTSATLNAIFLSDQFEINI